MSRADGSWTRHLRPSLAALSIYDVPPAKAFARLHANECPEPWPSDVMDEVAKVIREVELGRYPDTSGRSLRTMLAARHGCAPDHVVLGNGSDEVIWFLVTALSGPPDSIRAVVIPEPTFVMYGHAATVLGMPVRRVPLDDDLQLDAAAMHAALSAADVSLCFLARPNNPTGSMFESEVVHELVSSHPGVVFVIDEAYGAYAPKGSLWRNDNPPNMVHMSTLSKIALAAIRVGYCIATPDLATALNKVRPPYNVSQTSIAIAETILGRFADVQDAMIRRTIENRERLARLLTRIPGARVYPSAGNLVLVRLPSSNAAAVVHRRLGERGVLVKDMSAVPRLAGCLRVSVGTAEELGVLERALVDVRV